ncbi:MAG: hypothetical protein Q8862_07455, partial [Bacteroidota bacterium]|nr:hypothetical protein [Bacteroidota bacterium]
RKDNQKHYEKIIYEFAKFSWQSAFQLIQTHMSFLVGVKGTKPSTSSSPTTHHQTIMVLRKTNDLSKAPKNIIPEAFDIDTF